MERYGIAACAAVPLRAAADERSELRSQLLWGETFCVEEQAERWLRVRAEADGCEGWLNPRMALPVSEAQRRRMGALPRARCPLPLCYAACEATGQRAALPLGCTLYGYSAASGTFTLLDSTYRLTGAPFSPPPAGGRAAVVATAQQLLAAPYLWGGRTALGIDCSGLTQLACGMAGVALPRNAAQQAEQGEAVGAVEHAQPADLAFFANGEGRVVHVGIMLGQGEIIHASGSVRVDSVDQEGIRNRQLGSYTHRLKVVKRVLPRLAGGGG